MRMRKLFEKESKLYKLSLYRGIYLFLALKRLSWELVEIVALSRNQLFCGVGISCVRTEVIEVEYEA